MVAFWYEGRGRYYGSLSVLLSSLWIPLCLAHPAYKNTGIADIDMFPLQKEARNALHFDDLKFSLANLEHLLHFRDHIVHEEIWKCVIYFAFMFFVLSAFILLITYIMLISLYSFTLLYMLIQYHP